MNSSEIDYFLMFPKKSYQLFKSKLIEKWVAKKKKKVSKES
jgi:hypothetical protein